MALCSIAPLRSPSLLPAVTLISWVVVVLIGSPPSMDGAISTGFWLIWRSRIALPLSSLLHGCTPPMSRWPCSDRTSIHQKSLKHITTRQFLWFCQSDCRGKTCSFLKASLLYLFLSFLDVVTSGDDATYVTSLFVGTTPTGWREDSGQKLGNALEGDTWTSGHSMTT